MLDCADYVALASHFTAKGAIHETRAADAVTEYDEWPFLALGWWKEWSARFCGECSAIYCCSYEGIYDKGK